MVNVDAMDGIRYGIGLLKYLLLVGGGGGTVVAMIGFDMSGEAGMLVVLLGTLVVWAGMLGLFYKVVADGVERGVAAANGTLDVTAE